METLENAVFVNLDANAAPLAPTLSRYEPFLDHYLPSLLVAPPSVAGSTWLRTELNVCRMPPTVPSSTPKIVGALCEEGARAPRGRDRGRQDATARVRRVAAVQEPGRPGLRGRDCGAAAGRE